MIEIRRDDSVSKERSGNKEHQKQTKEEKRYTDNTEDETRTDPYPGYPDRSGFFFSDIRILRF